MARLRLYPARVEAETRCTKPERTDHQLVAWSRHVANSASDSCLVAIRRELVAQSVLSDRSRAATGRDQWTVRSRRRKRSTGRAHLHQTTPRAVAWGATWLVCGSNWPNSPRLCYHASLDLMAFGSIVAWKGSAVQLPVQAAAPCDRKPFQVVVESTSTTIEATAPRERDNDAMPSRDDPRFAGRTC